MKKSFSQAAALCAVTILFLAGCTRQEATETLNQAEQSAEDAVAAIGDEVGEAVEEGKELVGDLSEQAVAYLTPLKEKLAGLESLKDTPEELKKSVAELIGTIEDKAEDIQLPEAVSKALATVKEKLVALRDYLEGQFEQAKIDEHVKDIVETVKADLGLAD